MKEVLAVDVTLGELSYPVLIGSGLLTKVDLWRNLIKGEQAIVITNKVVSPLYTEILLNVLNTLNKKAFLVELDDGEMFKNWDSLKQILDAMMFQKCDRQVTVLALGGGVIGDMAGLAAALYMRGVALVQIPTTLLAQVDSSVGGKTAINHELGKNMIGAFYQPNAVVIDTETLKTLPKREFASGMAEMIKHGVILDKPYFDWLEQKMPRLIQQDEVELAQAIAKSCQLKAAVVARDERESGDRALLNFGHTFGHAIETGLGYGRYLHGEAVAMGMILATRLSRLTNKVDETVEVRLRQLLESARLPIQLSARDTELTKDRWLEIMQHDKKNARGEIRFVLLTQLGAGQVQTVSSEYLEEIL